MPFRKNLFGDSIAQPETTFSDIEQMVASRQFFDNLELASADLFIAGDDEFKFGGTLYFIIETAADEPVEEGDSEDIDYNDLSVEFDGFPSMADARAWVLNLTEFNIDINEVA